MRISYFPPIDVLAVQRFVPNPTKPSLQQIKNVKPASPAFNAGLRAGDYVLKVSLFLLFLSKLVKRVF